MLTKPFKPLALAFLVNLIISVEDKIKYIKYILRSQREDVLSGFQIIGNFSTNQIVL